MERWKAYAGWRDRSERIGEIRGQRRRERGKEIDTETDQDEPRERKEEMFKAWDPA